MLYHIYFPYTFSSLSLCNSENITYLCGVLLVIMPEVQDILIAHFSTESPPRKEESELFLNIQTHIGVCAICVGLTHSVFGVCGEPGRDMAMVYAFFLYLYEVCVRTVAEMGERQ